MSATSYSYLNDYMTGDRPTCDEVVRYARDLCRHLISDGLLSEYVTVGLDSAKRRAGVFRPQQQAISFSRLYLEHATVEAIQNTVLHEFAHACDFNERGMSDHGPLWKRWCARLGMDHAERCANGDEVPDMPRGKYEAVCDGCGQTGLDYRWKRTKAMTASRFLHVSCGAEVRWIEVAA